MHNSLRLFWSKNAFLSLLASLGDHSLWKINKLSLIKLWGKVVYRIEILYVDKLAAFKSLALIYLIFHLFLIDESRFLPDLAYTFAVFYNMF